jgi:hypothetical protein
MGVFQQPAVDTVRCPAPTGSRRRMRSTPGIRHCFREGRNLRPGRSQGKKLDRMVFREGGERHGQGGNSPARVRPALQLTIDRIQRAIRHIKNLVVRRERLILHEFGNSVLRLGDAGCLIEGSLLT